ncbi:MAG: trypsin-like peptidase domain-containing protein [Candidatus Faecivicinus sp.]|nr:trypsin-like peptidase domain-containing protein [Candidatus Faecivicinus sp.]
MKHAFFVRLLLVALALALLGSGAIAETITYDAVYSSGNPIPAIAAAVRPSVVEVAVSSESWDPITRVGTETVLGGGSGTYIRASADGGYILTNYHVVADAPIYTITWLDGTEMDAELVGYDDSIDIAILSFAEPAPEGANPVPLGSSDELQIGELVIAIGNPGAGADTLFGTVTAGIVSGLDREANANNFSRRVKTIQTDAAINSGNSGGALLNAKGELVGIPTLKYMYSFDSIYEGLGFCIPIDYIRDAVNQIIENGVVVRPRLGVMVSPYDGPEEPMKTIAPAGLQVIEVERKGAAGKAGVQVNDIIYTANGERIYTFADLSAVIDACGAGDELSLEIYRYFDEDGAPLAKPEHLTVEVELRILD